MCVYIIKKRVCIYMYMRVVLINILVLQLVLGSAPSWQKHFVDGHSIWERLDRRLLLRFGGIRVHHLHFDNFDHCPL